MKIITLTPNPSVDRTITLSAPLQRGEVQRQAGGRTDPGGKGVNISRALVASDIETVAVFPADNTDPIVKLLEQQQIPISSVPVGQPVRTNVTITEPDGTTTKINDSGAELDAISVAALIDATIALAKGAAWVVLAGSLPPGAGDEFYVKAVSALRETLGDSCPKIAVDTSGAPLAALIDSGVVVDLIKPNEEELAQVIDTYTAEQLESDPRLIPDAVAPLFAHGIQAALVTLGGKGAVLVTPAGAWHGIMPPIGVASTVGAGDSSLTGYIVKAAENGTPRECLAQGIANGTAAAGLPGSVMPARKDTHPDLATITPLSTTSTTENK